MQSRIIVSDNRRIFPKNSPCPDLIGAVRPRQRKYYVHCLASREKVMSLSLFVRARRFSKLLFVPKKLPCRKRPVAWTRLTLEALEDRNLLSGVSGILDTSLLPPAASQV